MEQNNDQLILYEALILRIGNEYNHNDMKWNINNTKLYYGT